LERVRAMGESEAKKTTHERKTCDSDCEYVDLNIKISPDLYRAYQRCSWIITHETGREQLDIMEEMVLDFLVKNEC
jgi:hypothetical protein